jgi:hypothetical protein
MACLDLINQAFSRACGDVTAKFCGFDREGHCFIAAETQQNILRLWQKVIASQQFVREGEQERAAPRVPGGPVSSADPETEAARPEKEVGIAD